MCACVTGILIPHFWAKAWLTLAECNTTEVMLFKSWRKVCAATPIALSRQITVIGDCYTTISDTQAIWGNKEVLLPSHRKGYIQGRQGDLQERETTKTPQTQPPPTNSGTLPTIHR